MTFHLAHLIDCYNYFTDNHCYKSLQIAYNSKLQLMDFQTSVSIFSYSQSCCLNWEANLFGCPTSYHRMEGNSLQTANKAMDRSLCKLNFVCNYSMNTMCVLLRNMIENFNQWNCLTKKLKFCSCSFIQLELYFLHLASLSMISWNKIRSFLAIGYWLFCENLQTNLKKLREASQI